MLIGLFRRISLEDNITKSKKMIFQPGDIWSGMSADAFTRRRTGEGKNYHDHLRRQIPFPECGVEMTAGSLTDHHRRMHGTKPEIDQERLLVR